MENKRTPEIRFLGFNGDWEQRKLDSIVDRLKSYSLSRDVERSEYTGYKYIHYGDIHTKVADVIDESSKLPNIKAGNYELLEKGDLVLADASEDYQGIATPAVITIDTPYKLVAGLHTIALRPKQVDSLFLYYLINSPSFRKYGYKTGTGMKVFGISVTNLLKFESWFPLLEEQAKIGKFLKQLDETFALYQQEFDTLKQTKQGFLQKMFPKEGESVPEIRFPGFTGVWEKRKIREIGDLSAGGDINKSKLVDNGDFPVLANALTNDGIVGYYDEYKIEAPAVTITGRGDVGHAKARHVSFTPVVRLLVLKANDFDVNFLENCINIRNIFVESTGVPQLTVPQLGAYEISFPSYQEQNKIGNFFKQLDDTISLHQRELDALQEMKKTFLQKMFV
ncbi:restriction endonuclease subunit S [Viridibacillus arvi]|uniref:restriction endonuclease subunit S n=1 Tax=Viridibacillus arvi TaxID=263475 RepID=UPI003D2BCF29